VDANGVYITTDQFTFATNRFNSTQLFTFSKQGLVSGTIQFFFRSSTNIAALQGANPRTAGETDPTNSGTEYFLASAIASDGTSALFLWSLTGTSTLADQTGASVRLSFRISNPISAEPFSAPALVSQRAGPTPFATANGLDEPLVDPGPVFFHQLVLASGRLWGAIHTGFFDGTANRSAIAWFSLIPSGPTATNPRPTATIEQQNYVRVHGNNLACPTIAVTTAGTPILSTDLAGPDYYPSTVYGRLPATPGAQAEAVLHVAGSGTSPIDDFATQVIGHDRWGDYTAAVSDGTFVWVAGEYVPARPRAADANWGTYIARVGDDEG
jgi:hypothetical protein